MKVLLTRPIADAQRSARRLVQAGFDPVLAPVIDIRPVDSALPEGAFDAVIVTSANAVPALAAHRDGIVGAGFFAVGARSAAALRDTGLGPVETAAEGASADLAALVVRRLRPGARLLHPAGRDRKSEPATSLAAAGFKVTPWIVYAAEAAADLPDAARVMLAGEGGFALHYSRRSLGILLDLAEKEGVAGPLLGLAHACLSADVAGALASRGAGRIAVAARPDEEALIAALVGLAGTRARARHIPGAKTGFEPPEPACTPAWDSAVTDPSRPFGAVASDDPASPGAADAREGAAGIAETPSGEGHTVQPFAGSHLPREGAALPLSALEAGPQEGSPQEALPQEASRDAASSSASREAEPPPAAAPSRGMAGLIGSGLLAGLVGAGLALAAQALWLSPNGRLEGRLDRIEQRLSTNAAQDASAGEARFAAIETELKATGERLRAARELAEAGAKRAEEAASRPPPPDPTEAARQAEAARRLGTVEQSVAARALAAADSQASTERRLVEQDQRLAALVRQVAEANPRRLEAGLRLMAGESVKTALREGRPLGPALALSARLGAEAASVAALQPYAEAAPPGAAALARDFKPVADSIRTAAPKPASGEWGARLLGLAEEIVTIRPLTPAPGGDPTGTAGRIEDALARGALAEAETAWNALPETTRAGAAAWGAALKNRLAAERAADALAAQALAAFDASGR